MAPQLRVPAVFMRGGTRRPARGVRERVSHGAALVRRKSAERREITGFGDANRHRFSKTVMDPNTCGIWKDRHNPARVTSREFIAVMSRPR